MIELITTMEPRALVTWLNGYLMKRTFLVGNHVTLADIMAYCYAFRKMLILNINEKYEVINTYRWANHI